MEDLYSDLLLRHCLSLTFQDEGSLNTFDNVLHGNRSSSGLLDVRIMYK